MAASLYRLSPAHLADAEEQFAAMRAALDERNARGLGPRRSDEWLAEVAVDAAVRGRGWAGCGAEQRGADEMSKREWSVRRARAHLLRSAADVMIHGDQEKARQLAAEAMDEPGRVETEEDFRILMEDVFGENDHALDSCVAEVYGAAIEPAPPAQNLVDGLKNAIRAIAVDDTQEERAALLRRLMDAVRAVMSRDLPHEALVEQIVSGIISAADKIDASTANERAALRIAAEAYFGGDFSKPEAP